MPKSRANLAPRSKATQAMILLKVKWRGAARLSQMPRSGSRQIAAKCESKACIRFQASSLPAMPPRRAW
jgi:hypothetical protein